MKYSWLLFDADGTLFDFEKSSALALEQAFEDLGVSFRGEYHEIYHHANMAGWKRFEQGEIDSQQLRVTRFVDVLEATGLAGDPAAFSGAYIERLAENHHLIEGAMEVVETLSRHSEMAIVTNGFAEVQRGRFGRSPITRFFSKVFISDELGAAKPHPKIFDEAFAQIGSPEKAEVLIIGDSLSSDIRGGSDYGIDTCWFNPGKKDRPGDLRIHHEVKSLAELLPTLLEG